MAATFAIAQSGNWNSSSTWTKTSGTSATNYPVAGDTVTSTGSDINKTITVPSSVSTGDLAPASTFYCLLVINGTLSIASGGTPTFWDGHTSGATNCSVTINNGGYLLLKNSVTNFYCDFTLNAGGKIAWNYQLQLFRSGTLTPPTWTVAGSSGNPAIIGDITVGTPAYVYNYNGGTTIGNTLSFSFATFNNVQVNSTGEASTTFTDCAFSGMSVSAYAPVSSIPATQILTFTRCSWSGTTAGSCLSLTTGYPSTGSYKIDTCSFDKPIQLSTPKGWIVTISYLVGAADGSVAPILTNNPGSWYDFNSNFVHFKSNTTTGEQVKLQGTIRSNVVFCDMPSVTDPNLFSCNAATADNVVTSGGPFTISTTPGSSTTLTVTALPTVLPVNAVLQFGSVQCRVKTEAAGGATSVSVVPMLNGAGSTVATGSISSGSACAPYIFMGNVYQGNQSANDAALYFTATVFTTSTDTAFNAIRNLILPNINNSACGPSVYNCTTTNSYCHAFVEHNTQNVDTAGGAFNGQALTWLGDSGSSGVAAKTLASCRSNLAWSANSAGSRNCVIYFSGGCTANDAADPTMTGYNGGANLTTSSVTGTPSNAWGLGTSGYVSATAYMFSTATVDGIDNHDVRTAITFKDSTRDLGTAYTNAWGSYAGNTTTGTKLGDAQALAAIIKSNPAYIPALYSWLQAGWAPSTAAYQNAGHDGTDIGAVQHSPVNPLPFLLNAAQSTFQAQGLV